MDIVMIWLVKEISVMPQTFLFIMHYEPYIFVDYILVFSCARYVYYSVRSIGHYFVHLLYLKSLQ